jgi:hypothetical protein
MIKYDKDLKWSANLQEIDLSIFEGRNLRVRKEVSDQIKNIIQYKDFRKNRNYGLSIIKKDIVDINVYISAINKVGITRRTARFYISTDCQSVMDQIVEATSYRDQKGDGDIMGGPIIPNYTGEEFSSHEKFIIDFFCLKSMGNMFSTPFNDYAYKTASLSRIGISTPNEEEIYKINWMDLVKT